MEYSDMPGGPTGSGKICVPPGTAKDASIKATAFLIGPTVVKGGSTFPAAACPAAAPPMSSGPTGNKFSHCHLDLVNGQMDLHCDGIQGAENVTDGPTPCPPDM